MKFIKIIFTFFMLVFVPIIISISVYHQSLISNRTVGCSSIYNKKYYRRKRDILKVQSSSWKFPIKYYVKPPVNSGNVRKAIEIISNNTCVKFEELSYPFDNEEGLIFAPSSGCSSFVGNIRKTSPQEIFLAAGCYNSISHILHEIGHALGLTHEHARSDRDKHVKIDLGNVKASSHFNFNKYKEKDSINYSTSYDFQSIMHYQPKDFAINNKKVVLSSKTHDPYNRMMGQRTKMTFNDIKQINLRHCDSCDWFGIDGKRNENYSNVRCRNGGYPHYHNCNKCICPTGYTGNDCTKIVDSDAACGNTTFHAKSYIQNLFFDDKKTCYIFLQAKRRKKIKINVQYSNTPFKPTCTEEISNQIKYKRDKGNTGLLLCGWYFNNVILTSESNSVLIIFRGFYRSSGIFLTFQEKSGKIRPRKPRSISKK